MAPDPCSKKRTDDINISYSLRKDQSVGGRIALIGSRLFAIAVEAGNPATTGLEQARTMPDGASVRCAGNGLEQVFGADVADHRTTRFVAMRGGGPADQAF